MQDHRVQVRDQVRALVTHVLAWAALPALQPSAWGLRNPTHMWRLITRHGQRAAHLLQEWSRSSFIITWPVRMATSLGGRPPH